MSGPVVGEEGNAGCILAAGGAFAVLFGTAWLLEKVMPTSIASTIAWVALVVFLVLVWKYGFKGRRNALLGSAAFGGIDDVRALASNKGDLLIGRSFRTGKLLRYDGPAHLLTMAPTRSGKGVGTIIPNLLTIDRSVICIDPKGENARVTARTRATKAQSAPSCDFGQVGERFGNVAFGIDDGNHRRGQFAPS